MKQKSKWYLKPLMATLMIVGILSYSTSSKAQVDTDEGDGGIRTAWMCEYTGMSISSCYYGGYRIINCQPGFTSCGY